MDTFHYYQQNTGKLAACYYVLYEDEGKIIRIYNKKPPIFWWFFLFYIRIILPSSSSNTYSLAANLPVFCW
jgi:hypothetical protein